jgi:hypothetical protein
MVDDMRRRAADAQRGVNHRNVLGRHPAGEIAEAITMVESGRTLQAVVKLKALLHAHGHPVPASPDASKWKQYR